MNVQQILEILLILFIIVNVAIDNGAITSALWKQLKNSCLKKNQRMKKKTGALKKIHEANEMNVNVNKHE